MTGINNLKLQTSDLFYKKNNNNNNNERDNLMKPYDC